MTRIIATVLGVAFLATSANAADFAVQTAGKSPAEVRAAVVEAARKACASAYGNDYLPVYISKSCVSDTVADAMSHVKSTELAMNTRTAR
jgi:hypothetical protein